MKAGTVVLFTLFLLVLAGPPVECGDTPKASEAKAKAKVPKVRYAKVPKDHVLRYVPKVRYEYVHRYGLPMSSDGLRRMRVGLPNESLPDHVLKVLNELDGNEPNVPDERLLDDLVHEPKHVRRVPNHGDPEADPDYDHYDHYDRYVPYGYVPMRLMGLGYANELDEVDMPVLVPRRRYVPNSSYVPYGYVPMRLMLGLGYANELDEVDMPVLDEVDMPVLVPRRRYANSTTMLVPTMEVPATTTTATTTAATAVPMLPMLPMPTMPTQAQEAQAQAQAQAKGARQKSIILGLSTLTIFSGLALLIFWIMEKQRESSQTNIKG